MDYKAKNEKDTENLGIMLGSKLKPGDIVCLYGDLGAGKTVFVRGLARSLGYKGRVTSPTFTIVNDYKDTSGQTRLLHFDMYRLSSSEDLFEIGWYDYLDTGAICAVEWAEKVTEVLPHNAFRVFITGSGDMERTIKIEGENL